LQTPTFENLTKAVKRHRRLSLKLDEAPILVFRDRPVDSGSSSSDARIRSFSTDARDPRQRISSADALPSIARTAAATTSPERKNGSWLSEFTVSERTSGGAATATEGGGSSSSSTKGSWLPAAMMEVLDALLFSISISLCACERLDYDESIR